MRPSGVGTRGPRAPWAGPAARASAVGSEGPAGVEAGRWPGQLCASEDIAADPLEAGGVPGTAVSIYTDRPVETVPLVTAFYREVTAAQSKWAPRVTPSVAGQRPDPSDSLLGKRGSGQPVRKRWGSALGKWSGWGEICLGRRDKTP